MNDVGITEIFTDYKEHFDNKLKVSDILFDYKCPNNLHRFQHTISRIKQNIKDDKYRCFQCENNLDDTINKINNKCKEKNFELIEYNKNTRIVNFKCKCGILNNRRYKHFIKKEYNGCNTCTRENPISTFNNIYGYNLQKCEKYKLINNEEVYLQSNEGLCFDYLLKQYDRKDLVISMELFYNYVEKVKNLLNLNIEHQTILNNLKIKLPIIYYDIYDGSHSYYPDGYIISTNTIIECKNDTVSEKTYRKIYGCLLLGYNVLLIRDYNNQIYVYSYTTENIDSFEFIFNKSLINKNEIQINKNEKIRPIQINIKAKAICRFDKNMNYIDTFNSINLAMNNTGDSEHWILSCCKNNGKYQYKKNHNNKYYWKYKVDYDKEQNNEYEFEFID